MSVLDMMADDLLLDRLYIESILRNVTGMYRMIKLSSGRVVWQPAPELALLQYWLVDWLSEVAVCDLPFATAYESGCSVGKNAERHMGAEHVLAMDIRDFFPSIGEHHIAEYLERSFPAPGSGYFLTEADVDFILSVALFRGGLVMGSPIAPFLANRVMSLLDERIYLEVTLPFGLTYTRYSDDLFFSSKVRIPDTVVREVSEILHSGGFHINNSKTRFMNRTSGIRITGLNVGPDGVTLGQKRKRQMKKTLYKFCVMESPSAADAQHLLGLLAFCKSIEPAYVGLMLAKYSGYGGDVMLRIRAACTADGDGHA